MSDDKTQYDDLIKEYRDITNNHKKIVEGILEKLKKADITIKDNLVESNVCFILSCPGECELRENKVCAGQTGENLEGIIKKLRVYCKSVFPNYDRYSYNLVNASQKVHFQALNGKTEDDNDVIASEDNIKRIADVIRKQKIKYVILCGKKAKLLDSCIKDIGDVKIAYVEHLGLQGINKQIKCDIDGQDIISLPKTDRTDARLEVIADSICKQLNKN